MLRHKWKNVGAGEAADRSYLDRFGSAVKGDVSCSAQKSVAGLKSRSLSQLHSQTLTGFHSLSNSLSASGRQTSFAGTAEISAGRGRTKVLRLRLAFCILHHSLLLYLWHNGPIRGESCKQCRTRTEEVVAMAIRPSSRPCPMSVSLRIFGSSFHFAVPGLRSIFWVPQLRR